MKLKISVWVLVMSFNALLFAQQKKTYTYTIKEGQELQLDVYVPEFSSQSEKLPTLVWMHGGGFSGGVRDNPSETKLCQTAAQQGFVAVSISYRLLRKGTTTLFGCDCPADEKEETFKQAAIDYMDAVSFLIERSDELHIDTSKLIAGGSSAGAEAILSAVYMPNYYLNGAYNQISFAGVFSLAGALVNLDEITSKTAVPTVLFHGIADNLVPYSKAAHHYCNPEDAGYLVLNGSDKIVDRLSQLGTSFLFYSYEKGRHEISGIPFGDLTDVFDFFKSTIVKDTHITKTISR